MNKYKIKYEFYNRGTHTATEYFQSWKTCQARIKELFEVGHITLKQVEVSLMNN